MIYVGIDIAKRGHFASAISSDGVELMKPFKFTNDGVGFQMQHFRLVELSCFDNSILIGLELTAHYGDNLVRYLVACDYSVCVEPHQNLNHAQDQDGQSRHIHHCQNIHDTEFLQVCFFP